MFIVIEEHYCRADSLREAEAAIEEDAKSRRGAYGFLFVHQLVAEDNPLLLTTITGWHEAASYNDWRRRYPQKSEKLDYFEFRRASSHLVK